MRKITVTTPGKLIITGEHSVVYGCPALAIPSHLGVTGTIQPLASQVVKIDSALFNREMNLTDLSDFKSRIDANYQAYLKQEMAINKVLPDSSSLLFYTVSRFASRYEITNGFKISLNSEIPIGAGMGSSAAVIVTILSLLFKGFEIEPAKEELLKLAKQCENLQHGQSSGLDIAVAVGVSPILYSNAMILPFKRSGFDVYVVNTGIPTATTGDCVNFVKSRFNTEFKEAFTKISNQIIKALTDKQLESFKNNINQNQLLLEQLGVVPTKVIEFRKALNNKYSASFKISGAGSTTGNSAGMGLIVSDQDPTLLCKEYGYQIWRTSL